jgi:hypothetical protein
MPDLERRLVALRDHIEYPPTPDLAPRVRGHLAEAGTQQRRALPTPWGLAPRAAIAGALAAFVVALGLTMAVSPAARSSILRWLGIEGVHITRVEHLPLTRAGTELGLGQHVSLREARRRAGFPVSVPSALGAPDEVHFARGLPGGAVSLVYRAGPGRPRVSASGVAVLITEFPGTVGRYVEKMLGPGTKIRNVTVGDGPAYLITGTIHAVIFEDANGEIREDRPRLATSTLLFTRGTVTFRLEGNLRGSHLMAIADSLR